MNNSGSTNIYTERIHQTVDYISGHLSENVTLEKLAAVACFSPFHFHRIFTAMIGETPRDYIERLRMEMAANRICVRKNTTISEIAFGCGFTSVSSFSRTFRKYHGVTPTGFLQKHLNEFHATSAIDHKRSLQKQGNNYALVQIKRLPAFHVAYTQTLEGYATGIPKAWNKLLSQMQTRGLLNDTSTLLGVPYDNPGFTPREKCRYRACLTVPEVVVLTRGEIKTTNIEEATYAVYHFQGTREDISNAYAFFYGDWLIQSGYLPDEKPLIELYPLSLMQDCSQNNLEYDIALPIVTI